MADSTTQTPRCERYDSIASRGRSSRQNNIQYDSIQDNIDYGDDGPTETTKLLQDNSNIPIYNEQTVSGPNVNSDVNSQTHPKRHILKNVILISISFMLLFTSYDGLAGLQSSLNMDEGLGVICQGIVYAVMITSSFFLPNLLIHFTGHKKCLVVCMIGYSLWTAANGYAVWVTMVIGSVLLGLGASCIWTAQSAYVSLVAQKYASISGESVEAVTSKFFGIFNAILTLSGLITASAQTVILHPEKHWNFSVPSQNETALCGLKDCPGNNRTHEENFDKIPDTVLWLLVGVYIGLTLLGIAITAIFVDNIPSEWLPEPDEAASRSALTSRQKICQAAAATVRLIPHPDQILLIPMSMYSGLVETFYIANYNESYVTCYLGMWIISLVALPLSLSNVLSSAVGGRLVKYTGLLPPLLTSMCMYLGVLLLLQFWSPQSSQIYLFFVVATVWGFADGIFHPLLSVEYGVLFPTRTEAAYSNQRLWRSLGKVLAYVWSSFLCTSIELYINLGFLGLGTVCLLLVHTRHCSRNSST